MNRFGKKKNGFLKYISNKLVFLVFLALFIVFLYGISTLNSTTKEKQLESLETAVNRSIVQCYAVEGTYPPSLDYLETHYGLIYDKDEFFVDYISIGANLMPDVVVLEKNNMNQQDVSLAD